MATYAWGEEGTEAARLRDGSVVARAVRRGPCARHAWQRGVTLIEVLIVVAILSLITTTVAVAVFPKLQGARIETAGQSAREIRNAVTRYRARGGDQCPTATQLVSEKEIDSASKLDDPSPFKIECAEDEVYVTSLGPDKKEGSTDDIVIPKKAGR
jgi:general secretion pathway protein G